MPMAGGAFLRIRFRHDVVALWYLCGPKPNSHGTKKRCTMQFFREFAGYQVRRHDRSVMVRTRRPRVNLASALAACVVKYASYARHACVHACSAEVCLPL